MSSLMFLFSPMCLVERVMDFNMMGICLGANTLVESITKNQNCARRDKKLREGRNMYLSNCVCLLTVY